jgi:hypothetical protein
MLTKATDDLIKDFSKIAGALLVLFGLMCLRAWLVSICAALLAPSFTLGFWQWFLIVATFRALIATDKAE